jgi:hypothetical protein
MSVDMSQVQSGTLTMPGNGGILLQTKDTSPPHVFTNASSSVIGDRLPMFSDEVVAQSSMMSHGGRDLSLSALPLVSESALKRSRGGSQSQSIADLPSALKEIFSQNVISTRERLKSMKPLTKSCADLRNVNLDEFSEPTLPQQPAPSTALPSIGQNPFEFGLGFKAVRPHQLPSEYLSGGATQGRLQYKTIHSIPQTGGGGRSRVPLSRAESDPKRPGSVSDNSDDESYGSLLKHSYHKPQKSPTRPAPRTNTWFSEDPSLILKAKLKHAHSLTNLPEVVQNEQSAFNFNPQLPHLSNMSSSRILSQVYSTFSATGGRPIPSDSVYHTIHAGSNPTTTRFARPRPPPLPLSYTGPGHSPPELPPSASTFQKRNAGEKELELLEGTNSAVLLEEELEPSSQELLQYSSVAPCPSTLRSGSPSSGYRTMGPVGPYPYATISTHTDPSLAQYIKDRDLSRIQRWVRVFAIRSRARA